MTWNAFGRAIETRVDVVYRMESERLRSTVEFIMSPGVLDGLPTVYYAAARLKPAAIPALQRDSYRRFPTVTIVNVADILDRVQEIVNQISIVIRFISAFTIAAGAIILASSIAGTKYRRTREVVIFKTLGATRGRIARMFSAEFLIIGTVAGLMGSGLATVFSSLVLSRFFEASLRVDPAPAIAGIAATALIAAASGWLASFRILGQKPLEVLRGE
jgi:putative ABC transport system permease protein